MCAYLMICLHNTTFNPSVSPVLDLYQQHSLWDSRKGWKSASPQSLSAQSRFATLACEAGCLRSPQRIGRSKQYFK